jgi:hypothetical protein
MAVRPRRDGRYVVETAGGRYVVDPDGGSCTCPDARIRGARCKHRRRVAVEVAEGLVPAPGERTAVCAVCGGRTFVPSEATGPALCARHAFAPGSLVVDRETGDRLIVVAGPGGRADRVRTDEGRLVAAYPSNAACGGHEPVFRVVYLDALRRDGPVRRYAFPASRLRPAAGDRPRSPPSASGGAAASTGRPARPSSP